MDLLLESELGLVESREGTQHLVLLIQGFHGVGVLFELLHLLARHLHFYFHLVKASNINLDVLVQVEPVCDQGLIGRIIELSSIRFNFVQLSQSARISGACLAQVEVFGSLHIRFPANMC